MAAGHRDALDQAVADLLGELRELVAAQALEVGGGLDGREQSHGDEGRLRSGQRSRPSRSGSTASSDRCATSSCLQYTPPRPPVPPTAPRPRRGARPRAGPAARPPAGPPRRPAGRRRWTWPAPRPGRPSCPALRWSPVQSSTSSAIWKARPMSSPKAVSAATSRRAASAAMPPRVQEARISAPVLPRCTADELGSVSVRRSASRSSHCPPTIPSIPPAWNSSAAIRPSTAADSPSSRGGPGQHPGRHRHQQEADPGGGGHVEAAVGGGTAAAEIVVVHAGQVVVDQRVGVHGLDRRRHAGDRRRRARRPSGTPPARSAARTRLPGRARARTPAPRRARPPISASEPLGPPPSSASVRSRASARGRRRPTQRPDGTALSASSIRSSRRCRRPPPRAPPAP